jgi:hypothetical protein
MYILALLPDNLSAAVCSIDMCIAMAFLHEPFDSCGVKVVRETCDRSGGRSSARIVRSCMRR